MTLPEATLRQAPLSRHFVGLLIACLVAGLVTSCAEPTDTDRAVDLMQVPTPVLDDIEPAVVKRLRQSRSEMDAEIEAAVGGTETVRLGEVYGRQARLYQAHSLFDVAEVCYLNAHRLEPEEFRWLYYLGRVHKSRGDFSSASEFMRRALELRPDDLPARVTLGEVERQQNQLDAATAAYREALRHAPDLAAAHDGLGRVALARGDYAEAAQELERALELAPEARGLYYPLGLAYRGLGRMEDAAAALQRRGDGKPGVEDPLMDSLRDLEIGMRLHLNRGTTAFLHKRFDAAAEEYRRAVEADPESALARMNLAAALKHLNDLQGAMEHTKKALEIDADDPRANFGMATLLSSQGRDEEAIDFHRRALDADPDYEEALFNLANALHRMGRYQESAQHYERAIEINPDHAVALYGLASSLALAGRWREALAEAEASHYRLDGSAALTNALVRLLAASPVDELRDGARALPLAEDLFQQASSLPNVEALAMALAEAGRFDEAVLYQEAALAAAQRTGSAKAVAKLQRDLARYRSGLPCRRPW